MSHSPEKPGFIKQAMLSGNKALLSAAGKKGAEMRQTYKEANQQLDAEESLRGEISYWESVLQANGVPESDVTTDDIREYLTELYDQLAGPHASNP